MKFAVIQPAYSMEFGRVDECFEKLLAQLEECDSSLDVIVLPEYSDVPANIRGKEEYDSYVVKNNARILDAAAKAAVRCSATVFVNAASQGKNGYINTTYAIDKNGNTIGKYLKAHPAPSEVNKAPVGIGLDVDYSYSLNAPYILEIDGVRYGFMTCYDFYFYESFARLARENVDVIIGCSLQRTDKHQALEIIGRFLSYNTNAYLVRSSVSLGLDSPVGGSSMIVAPDGTMLANLKSEVGMAVCDIDPHEKYYKPAGFGGKPKSHYEYMEDGRRPWSYRPAGSAIVMTEKKMPYPRICAHRGFSTVAPENTMPAFGAAIALGAEEIEFDLWPTKDGEIVSCHDSTLDRVSTGTGKIYDHTLEELKQLDFGVKYNEKFKGLSIVTLEEILGKFAGHTIMNIHVKPLSLNEPYPEETMKKIVALIRKYNAEQYVYFMLEPDIHIKQFKEYAPDIPVCVGHLGARPWEIVERAIELGAEKVQFFKPYYNKEKVDLAHKNGIICNVFWSDKEDEAAELLEMGMDTILTNDFNKIANHIKGILKNK